MPIYEIDPQKLLTVLGKLTITETRSYMMNNLSAMIGGICNVDWAQPKEQPVAKKSPRKLNEAGYSERFEEFWKLYPRKVGKGAAWKAWERIRMGEADLLHNCLCALGWQIKQEQWVKDNGSFIPHPQTYLNQRRWEDGPTEHEVGEGEMFLDMNGNWRKKT